MKNSRPRPMTPARPSMLLAGLAFLAVSAAVDAAYTCLPTCQEDDARFLAIPCNGLATLANSSLRFEFVALPGATSLEIGIFDGDTGGHWDLRTQQLEYTLLADPRADGTGNPVGSSAGGAIRHYSGHGDPFHDGTPVDNSGTPMPDNDWFIISLPSTDLAKAKAANGYYYFHLDVVLPALLTGTQSAFKVRTNGIVYIPAATPFAFLAALELTPSAQVPFADSDAAIVYPNWPTNWKIGDPIDPSYVEGSTYDGEFDFHFFVPAPVGSLAIWDGDLDHGSWDGTDGDTDDPDTPYCVEGGMGGCVQMPANSTGTTDMPVVPPNASTDNARNEGAQGVGAPADDSPFIPYVRSPSVTYDLLEPGLSKDYPNLNPSGNQEWEQFKITTDPNATRSDADYGPSFVGDDGVTSVTEAALPAGIYHVHAHGMDMANLNLWWFPCSALGVADDGDPPTNVSFAGMVEGCVVTDRGRMTGGGSIGDSGVTHGFELHCDASQGPNNLQVNWGGHGSNSNSFHLDTLDSALCEDNPTFSEGTPVAGFDTYHGTGTGTFNAAGSKGSGVPGYTAEWTFTDHGQPGFNDTAEIVIKDPNGVVVLTVSGNIHNGNNQAHP
jgi:hypothetical protein